MKSKMGIYEKGELVGFVDINETPASLEQVFRARKAKERGESKPSLGEHLSLKDLEVYSGLSNRNLRTRIASPVDPIPHQRVGHRILVKKVDFDVWLAQHRKVGSDVEARIEQMREREKRARKRKAPAPRRRTT